MSKVIASIECFFCKKTVETENLKKSPIELAKENDFLMISISDLRNKIFESFFICKECYQKIFFENFFLKKEKEV